MNYDRKDYVMEVEHRSYKNKFYAFLVSAYL